MKSIKEARIELTAACYDGGLRILSLKIWRWQSCCCLLLSWCQLIPLDCHDDPVAMRIRTSLLFIAMMIELELWHSVGSIEWENLQWWVIEVMRLLRRGCLTISTIRFSQLLTRRTCTKRIASLWRDQRRFMSIQFIVRCSQNSITNSEIATLTSETLCRTSRSKSHRNHVRSSR